MTTAKPVDTVASSETAKEIQLKKLPTLEEVPANELEDPLQNMLGRAIAIQLKAMRKDSCISEFGLENLILLVEEYLSDMLKALKKMANVQRRHCICKKDLLLILKGYDLEYADLVAEFERSQFVKSQYPEEVQHVNNNSRQISEKKHTQMSEKELLEGAHSEFFVKDVEILDLVPPSNKNNKYVPKWLPDFPPDHTYRFTSQYNKPITDERQMKRKLVEEANHSEQALIKFMKEGFEEEKLKITNEKSIFEESQQETLLIYGPPKKKKSKTVNSVNELLRTLPLNNYNVEEYARNRVEIARRKVLQYERHQLQLQKNPFIKAAHLASPFGKNPINTKHSEKELTSMLQRSYVGLMKSIPLLKEKRKREEQLARERRRLREEQIRQEKQNQRGSEYEVLDLSNLNEDPFFGDLGSSDSDEEHAGNNDAEATELHANITTNLINGMGSPHSPMSSVDPSQPLRSSSTQADAETTLDPSLDASVDLSAHPSAEQSQEPYLEQSVDPLAEQVLEASEEPLADSQKLQRPPIGNSSAQPQINPSSTKDSIGPTQ
ncbi:LAFE_0G07316g1_1 [Lachancea fermentati]|uniref:Transcription initiation factor TFIID subunit 8 n=1 Tax=Lachancea fermentati TaxID=4955 RepID=A0A1G4MHM9_LACFM|nr:LAFE_0G07316g1_1 [Lachancea fermentati]